MRIARDSGASVALLAKGAGISAAHAWRLLSKTRTAEEFATSASVQAPRREQTAVSWSLETIRAARDAQMRGDFKLPGRLAEALRTDDAAFVAYHNRIAPQNAIAAKLCAHGSTRGASVARCAGESVTAPRSVLASIAGTLANHGLAIGFIKRETADDGSTIDFRLTEWPLEHVKWNASTEQLETAVKDGGVRQVIAHGDGTWIVFRKFLIDPWKQEACILPAAFVWAAHANGLVSWAATANSHGQAKIVGELPAGVALQKKGGGLTPEALGFLAMLQDLVSGESGAGLRPPGSKTEFLANGSTAWQVFSELIQNREKAFARIYLGTDAILGSVGGAPGVDISALFAVAITKLQGDFEALAQGLNTGLYQPWTALNYGDSRYSPSIEFLLPDADAAKKSEERGANRNRLTTAVKEMRDQGFLVDQTTVNVLAKEFNVEPAPVLAAADTRAVPIPLAPTDIAKVVKVSAALRSIGLDPFGDERDNMTITELDEFNKAKAATKQAAGEAQVAATTPPAAPAVPA